MLFCSHCGRQLTIGTEKFCPNCGQDLKSGGVESTTINHNVDSIRIEGTGGDVFGVGGSGNIVGKNVVVGSGTINVSQQSVLTDTKVSYIEFDVKSTNYDEILDRIASLINVKLKEDYHDVMPFIFPNNFNEWRHKTKLLLYGKSGCGKSRTIFEIVKSNLKNFGKIYILNPQGHEKKLIAISELIRNVKENDAIIWDNFPIGLEEAGLIEKGLEALSRVSLANARNKFITLQPDFLESYRKSIDKIPFITKHNVSYDQDGIKNIIEAYGTSIAKFRESYYGHVKDNINRISSILWEKGPYPLVVKTYYDKLINYVSESTDQHPITSINLAQTLEPLEAEYYKAQFENLRDSHPNEADFLYTLKLCYDIGLRRTLEVLKDIQYYIFETWAPHNPSRALETWIYFSDTEYCMPDVERDAIEYPIDYLPKILQYLIVNFFGIFPDEPLPFGVGWDMLRSFGNFIGKYLQFLQPLLPYPFVPSNIYELLKDKWVFQQGLASGVGESISSQNNATKSKILEIIEQNIRFADTIFISELARCIEFSSTNDKDIQQRILEMAKNRSDFAKNLNTRYIVKDFILLDIEIQENIFELAKVDKNFSSSLAYSFGEVIASLNDKTRHNLLKMAEDNIPFACGLVGNHLTFLGLRDNDTFKQELLRWAFGMLAKDRFFDEYLGSTIGEIFSRLEHHIQQEALNKIKQSRGFAYCLGNIGSCFADIKLKDVQHRILEIIDENNSFAEGLGSKLGSGFSSLNDKEMQEKILTLARKNSIFGNSLVQRIGLSFPSIKSQDIKKQILELIQITEKYGELFFDIENTNNEDRIKIWDTCKKNHDFAIALGSRIAKIFSSLNNVIQYEILNKVENNYSLRKGFACNFQNFVYIKDKSIKYGILALATKNASFGRAVMSNVSSYMDLEEKDIQEKIIELIGRDGKIASYIGISIGLYYSALEKTTQERLFNLAQRNREFRLGLACYLGEQFPFIRDKTHQVSILELVERDVEFGCKLALRIGPTFSAVQDDQIREKIWEFVNLYPKFAYKIGLSFGFNFEFLANDLKSIVLDRLEKNGDFAAGFAESYGLKNCYTEFDLGDNMWDMAERSNNFAISLGYGIGKYIFIHSDRFIKYVQTKLQNNIYFQYGFGYGLSQYDLSYFISAPVPETDLPIPSRSVTFLPSYLKGFENKRDVILSFVRFSLNHVAYGFGVGLDWILKNANFTMPYEKERFLMENPAFAAGFKHSLNNYFSQNTFESRIAAIVIETNNDIISYLKGLGLYNSKKYMEAIEFFDKFLALYPYERLASAYKSYALDMKGLELTDIANYHDAMEKYHQALNIWENPYFWDHIGQVHDKNARYDEALECYNKSIEIYDKVPAVFYHRSKTNDILRNYLESIRDKNTADDLNRGAIKSFTDISYM